MSFTDYEIVTASETIPANTYSVGYRPSVIAYLPEGKVILGGGALGHGGITNLVSSYPSGVDNQTTWTSVHEVIAGLSSFPAFTIESYLICATVS